MRTLVALIVVLCSCATGCNERDTKSTAKWPVKPRLSLEPRRNAPVRASCDEPVESHFEAVQLLATQARCTDRAIAELRSFVPTEPHAQSDLAAAYYLRAEREKTPIDYLRAHREAERAVAMRDPHPAALFNLALVQEKIGLTIEARESWKKLSNDSQAGEHRDRLNAMNGAAEWKRTLVALRAALARRDALAVRKLIEPFPRPALDYWNDLEGEPAELLASEISRRLGKDALKVASVASEASLARLERLEADARRRNEPYLAARIAAQRAYQLTNIDSHVNALAAYDAALETFLRLNDTEMIASVRRSRVGAYNALGQHELAWQEAMQLIPLLPRMVRVEPRNSAFGEIQTAATSLGYPEIGMLYEDASIHAMRTELRDIPPEHLELITMFEGNLAIALRARAEVALQRGLHRQAEKDISDAINLSRETKAEDNSLKRRIRIHIDKVRARAFKERNPTEAVKLFTNAIESIPAGQERTLKAKLFSERAEVLRRLRRTNEAANDLEMAVNELRQEESSLLRSRKRGDYEDVWLAYFSRFQETWAELVAQFMEQKPKQHERAFDSDERSRAFEPLDLILELAKTPQSFRKLVPDGEPMRLAEIQRQLPAGTALLQYRVLPKRTYAWIVTRDRFEAVTLDVQHEQIEQWSNVIQRPRRLHIAVDDALQDAHRALIATPLAAASRDKKPDRIVIVPDGPMHGLPFAALQNAATKKYLIEQAPIELAGSATLYVYSLLRDAAMPRTDPPSALLVGNPDFDKTFSIAGRYDRLPHADAEVEAISKFYSPRAEVLKGKEATVAAFLSRAQNKTILHVAGHSIVNSKKPWLSILLLAMEGDDTGAIEAQQLLKNLKLDRTRLVVLAACSSAGGNPTGPMGVAPLVRPLLSAGVPAVVGTLWDVQDATAQAVSVSFHRHYERGDDAAKALQNAQLRMLRDGQRPLKWAPYQVIGHASSPFGSTPKRVRGGTQIGIHRSHSLQRDDGLHPQQ